jgi:SAM-dependent methyltransferase
MERHPGHAVAECDRQFGQTPIAGNIVRRLWRIIPKRVRARFWAQWGHLIPYQKMVCKGKVLSPGYDRTFTYRLLFPSAPTGKTILDVGCHTGSYCLMAASEGAEYCMGIDIEPSRIKKGQLLIEREGIANVHLVAVDAFQYEPVRRFDIVLCLNVLQHVGTIERLDQLLNKLYSLAERQLLLIVPLPDTPAVAYEHAIRGKINYLLVSGEYFEQRYPADSVRVVALDASYYGPNRAAIFITKTGPPPTA